MIGMWTFSRSYQRAGANTGPKCLGRILIKGSLWMLGGLALVSAGLLIKEHKTIDEAMIYIRTLGQSFLAKIKN